MPGLSNFLAHWALLIAIVLVLGLGFGLAKKKPGSWFPPLQVTLPLLGVIIALGLVRYYLYIHPIN